MVRRLALTLALAAPALSRADLWSLDVEAYGGYDKYDALGLKSGVASLSNKALLKDASTHLGLSAIAQLALLEVGALAEVGRVGSSSRTTTLAALGGLGFGSKLRLELLGEAGGQRYGSFLEDPSVVQRAKSEAWLVHLGLRPGLSWRTDGVLKLVVGVWAFARWNVTTDSVAVTYTPAGGGTANATYKLGGSSFGASLRLGLAL